LKATQKKNQKVVRATGSPGQRWPPRQTKNGDLSIVFFSWVGLRTYQHPCTTPTINPQQPAKLTYGIVQITSNYSSPMHLAFLRSASCSVPSCKQ